MQIYSGEMEDSFVTQRNVRSVLLAHLSNAMCKPIDRYVYERIAKFAQTQKDRDWDQIALVKRVLLEILKCPQSIQTLKRAILLATPQTEQILGNILQMYGSDIRQECGKQFQDSIKLSLNDCIRKVLVALRENAHVYSAKSGATYQDALNLMKKSIRECILESLSVECALSLSTAMLQSSTRTTNTVSQDFSSQEFSPQLQFPHAISYSTSETYRKMRDGRSPLQSPPPSPPFSFQSSPPPSPSPSTRPKQTQRKHNANKSRASQVQTANQPRQSLKRESSKQDVRKHEDCKKSMTQDAGAAISNPFYKQSSKERRKQKKQNTSQTRFKDGVQDEPKFIID